MNEAAVEMVPVGSGDKARAIAVLHRAGAAPGLFWLGGFRSDMAGSKATAIDAFAARRGLAATRFDYSGHGRSGGDFADGTISRWLEEARAVFDRQTAGPQIVIGSSMGGWIALLLAEALKGSGRIAGHGADRAGGRHDAQADVGHMDEEGARRNWRPPASTCSPATIPTSPTRSRPS